MERSLSFTWVNFAILHMSDGQMAKWCVVLAELQYGAWDNFTLVLIITQDGYFDSTIIYHIKKWNAYVDGGMFKLPIVS